MKDFPSTILDPLNLDAKSADASAIRNMREHFKKPAMTVEAPLLKMEAEGLLESADLLKPYLGSLPGHQPPLTD